jgi:hypothetical protein
MTIAIDLMKNTRINPIKPQNKVKLVTKTTTGSLIVELNSGSTFELSEKDEMFQTFIVYTMLKGL